MEPNPPSKPIPVRPPGSPDPPTRGLSPAEGRAPAGCVAIEPGGVTWWVRVVGQGGGVPGRSPPLLLLGFWETQGAAGPPVREAILPGRVLEEIGTEQLEEAWARAVSPPADGRRRPFFESVGQGRRGGAPARSEEEPA